MTVSRCVQIALLGLLSSCSLGPLSDDCAGQDGCDCSEERRLEGGACCPLWTRADASGTCVERAWVVAEPAQYMGGGLSSLALGLDAEGMATLTWAGRLSPSSGDPMVVVAQEHRAEGWTLRVASQNLSGRVGRPTLALGSRGEALVAWAQGPTDSSRIMVAERALDGVWQDPDTDSEAISFQPQAYEPRPLIRSSGERLLVWNQRRSDGGYGVGIATRAGIDGLWQRPSDGDDALSPAINFSNAPQIAANARGQALISWYQSTGDNLLVYMSERSREGEAFSRATPADNVSAEGAPVDSHSVANPKAAIAEDGRAAIAWTQEDGAGASPVYVALRDRAGNWQRPSDLSDALSARRGRAIAVQATFAPSGALYLTWYQDQAGGRGVYLAMHDGIRWRQRGRLLSAPAADAIHPMIAAGASDAVVVVWRERAGGEGLWQIMARRNNGRGADGVWGPVAALSTAGDVGLPVVAVGGPGGRALVAWSEDARVAFAMVD